MLSIDEIKERLKDANISKISRGCGVHMQTIYRLIQGKDIRVSSVQKLSDYLSDK